MKIFDKRNKKAIPISLPFFTTFMDEDGERQLYMYIEDLDGNIVAVDIKDGTMNKGCLYVDFGTCLADFQDDEEIIDIEIHIVN